MNAFRRRAGLMVAVAMVGVATAAASAQIYVGSDGRSLDANQRVGSGGYNTPRPNLMLFNSVNDPRNISSGKGFRGNLTGDPSQPFGGFSNLPSDIFARQSNPVVPLGAAPLPPGTAIPLYSSSPIGTPPAGFALNPSTGQYRLQTRPELGATDIQYGVPPGTPILRPSADGESQLVLPATIFDREGNGVPMTLTATPLLGIRPLSTLSDEDSFLLSRSGGGNTLDPATLRKLRSEMSQQIAVNPQLAEQFRRMEEQSTLEQDAKDKASKAQGPIGAKPLQNSLGTGQIDPSIASDPLTGPNPGFFRAPKYDPAERNPVLAELRKAELERAKNAPKSPGNDLPGKATSNRDAPNKDAPTSRTSDGAIPRNPIPNNTLTNGATNLRPPTNVPVAAGPQTLGYVAPIHVGALSETHSQQGIKMLLASGEKLLAEGKYASASDRFDTAAKFAPGDELIVIDRAQAELGAGFFLRARESLRAAVATDPAILNAQYDLKKLLGEARVDTLVSDLKRIALEDKTDAVPITLLAYLAYNSGDEERAIALLNEAHNRNANDPLVAAMQARWAAKK